MSSRQATAQTNLDAISRNFDQVRQLAPSSKIMAVIKADAYGHGAAQVAKKLKQADAFAVARVSEAVKLREAGVGGTICLLEGVMNREDLNLASIYELQVVVHSEDQLELMTRSGARRDVWLKIDTGMGRLGIRPEKADSALQKLDQQRLIGLMTHFAQSDEVGAELTVRQIEKIRSISRQLYRHNPAAAVISMANSAGIMAHADSRSDWIRPGLMLYGASPLADLEPDPDLHPAMHFSAPVISIRDIKVGDSVGYGSIWTTERDTRIAVVGAGYADGYPREMAQGTPVLVNGERRRLVGRVSMDMITVELEKSDVVEMGDHVTLWGEGLPVEEIARCAGTIPYTLTCGIAGRVRRTFRGEVRG
ncbi:MAG: alanine racemase [Gammaproteobacteria bacterium]|nr:alanine racemase [Gammaproteobacteria bacterium]